MPRNRNTAAVSLWLASLTLLAACSTFGSGPEREAVAKGGDSALKEEQSPLRESPPTPPDAVFDALLPKIAVDPQAAVAPPEPRFDITVANAPARDFFMGLVESTPHNMVLDPAVEGRVTLALKNVTIPEVMRAARDAFGYEFRKTVYGFHVLPAGLHTRVFKVDYLNVVRKGSSLTQVNSGQISQKESSGGSGALGGGGASGSSLDTRTNVDFWEELRLSLEAIVGRTEGRSVVVTPHAGLVVVRANAASLREVEGYLKSVEENLNRQVILEAKILEIELSDEYQAGINWTSLANRSPDILIGQTGGGTVINDGTSEISGNKGSLDPRVKDFVDGAATSAFGGVFTLAVQGSRFVAFIELLETQGNVHVLSSPRIATINNQKAVIKVGSDEFFVTDVSSTTVTGTATTTSPSIELTPFFSGIALDVTPQISGDREVVLHIHPSVSEVRDQTKQVDVGGETQSLPLALSTIRESDSIVRARSGEIIVIGGLMQNLGRDADAGIPWISRTPLLGRLFRHEKKTSRKSELVILLRPLVVAAGGWDEHLGNVRERLNSIREGASNLLNETSDIGAAGFSE